jgi:hypothetical protein
LVAGSETRFSLLIFIICCAEPAVRGRLIPDSHRAHRSLVGAAKSSIVVKLDKGERTMIGDLVDYAAEVANNVALATSFRRKGSHPLEELALFPQSDNGCI